MFTPSTQLPQFNPAQTQSRLPQEYSRSPLQSQPQHQAHRLLHTTHQWTTTHPLHQVLTKGYMSETFIESVPQSEHIKMALFILILDVYQYLLLRNCVQG